MVKRVHMCLSEGDEDNLDVTNWKTENLNLRNKN